VAAAALSGPSWTNSRRTSYCTALVHRTSTTILLHQLKQPTRSPPLKRHLHIFHALDKPLCALACYAAADHLYPSVLVMSPAHQYHHRRSRIAAGRKHVSMNPSCSRRIFNQQARRKRVCEAGPQAPPPLSRAMVLFAYVHKFISMALSSSIRSTDRSSGRRSGGQYCTDQKHRCIHHTGCRPRHAHPHASKLASEKLLDENCLRRRTRTAEQQLRCSESGQHRPPCRTPNVPTTY
jgi:hypothetical protein